MLKSMVVFSRAFDARFSLISVFALLYRVVETLSVNVWWQGRNARLNKGIKEAQPGRDKSIGHGSRYRPQEGAPLCGRKDYRSLNVARVCGCKMIVVRFSNNRFNLTSPLS